MKIIERICNLSPAVLLLGMLLGHTANLPDETGRYGYPEGTVLKRGPYAVAFDGGSRCPRWTLEVLSREVIAGDASRVGLRFKSDADIPIEFRPTITDYMEPVYDIGHMVAANDYGERENVAATFVFTNACPQVPEFNRGVWRRLEDHVRELASEPDRDAWVVTAPYWTTGTVQEIGPTRVRVPHGFGKAVLLHDENGLIQLQAWLIPHRGSEAGLDVFAGLTDDTERRLEARR
jgi:endonuclease G